MELRDIYWGNTRIYRMEFRDEKTQQPIPLTGGTITFTLKRRLEDSDSQALIQVDTGALPENPETRAGKAVLTLSSDVTKVEYGPYTYDFQLKFPGTPNKVTTLRVGKIKVAQVATHG